MMLYVSETHRQEFDSLTLLRPHVSMRYSAGTVPTTDTPPSIVCITYGESLLGFVEHTKPEEERKGDARCAGALEERITIII